MTDRPEPAPPLTRAEVKRLRGQAIHARVRDHFSPMRCRDAERLCDSWLELDTALTEAAAERAVLAEALHLVAQLGPCPSCQSVGEHNAACVFTAALANVSERARDLAADAEQWREIKRRGGGSTADVILIRENTALREGPAQPRVSVGMDTWCWCTPKGHRLPSECPAQPTEGTP